MENLPFMHPEKRKSDIVNQCFNDKIIDIELLVPISMVLIGRISDTFIGSSFIPKSLRKLA